MASVFMASLRSIIPWSYSEFLLAFACFFLLGCLRRKDGPVTNWPIVGMLPSLFMNIHRAHEWGTGLLRDTGCTFKFNGPWFTQMDIVCTCHPANVNHIFSTNFTNFPKGPLFSKIFAVLGDGIFNSDSEPWRIQRKMAHSLISSERFRAFVARTSQAKVDKGLVHVLKNIIKQGEGIVDLQDVFQRFTFDTTCILVFGVDPGCLAVDFPIVPFAKAMDDAMEAILFRHVIPESWWMLLKWLNIGWEKKLAEGWKIIDQFINQHISTRREELHKSIAHGRESDCEEGGDLLTAYINYRHEDGLGLSNSDKFLRDTAVNLMLVGRDTTSSALTWFFWVVSMNPEVETKILQELKAISPKLREGGHGKPKVLDAEELSQLVYLHAALCESLRLFPPVPFELKSVVQPQVLPTGSEEEFRLALRNGIILCNILNKVQPGAIPKVVEVPVDSVVLPDGAALSAYQHFENIRNFLDAMQEMGLPSFAASDLEKGGNGVRVMNCILALKSYCGWKEAGGNGSWKYGGNLKSINSTKSFVRKNSEPFTNSLLRTASTEKSLDSLSFEQNGELPKDSSKMNTSPLNALVHAVLADKRPEEIPMLVESMLSKVMEEFEHRLASQNELVKKTENDLAASDGNKSITETEGSDEMKVKTTVKDLATSDGNKSIIETESSGEMKVETSVEDLAASDENESIMKTENFDEMKMNMEEETGTQSKDEELFHIKPVDDEESKCRLLKQQMLFEKQQREIRELKHVLHATRTGMQFIQTNYSEEFCNLGKHLHVVSQAASGYHKLLEENRKLYNHVQDLKGSIRVYCRVRPFLHGHPDRQSTVDRIDDGSITVITPSKYGKEGRKSFNFNKVFGPSATQEEVFIDTQPLIRSVLDGYNVCIFAYGQTGSGKTFTMSGPNELTEESQGVNYRALNDLFYLSKQRKGTVCYDISVQMLEIYNEQVRDLLASDGLNKRLEIHNSSQKGLNVPDANLVPVASTLDVIELMNTGQKNRAVSSTAMNDRSSRSHSCLTVHVQGRDTVSGTILRGSLHLVDLAGSERVDKSEVVGDRLKEAQHINKSLAALGDVISALAQKNSHVPYRNSKLTQLLQDSLGGQAKTLMFVHISPEVDAIGETISTLKFAERVATIELGAARANKETGDVRALKEQIANLKAALARKEGEPEHLSSSILSSEVSKMKAGGLSVSSIHSNQQNGDMLIDHSKHRQPMEDVGNIEVSSNCVTKQNGPNLDHLELLIPAKSPSWAGNSPGADLQEGDEKDVGSDDWVEKTMVKKNEAGGAPLRRRLEGSNGSLPESFYQKALSEAKIHPEKQYKTPLTRKDSRGYESATTDDSDDLEMASSDCSEGDALWQCSLPKVSSPANGVGSKNRKPHTRPAKGPDLRSPSPSPFSRKLRGGSQTPNRNVRPPSVDGKRSSSSRKSGSGK